jgi:hypothetical protein
MQRLLSANQGRIGHQAGLAECVASLPVQYIGHDVLAHPAQYGLSTESFEYGYEQQFINEDINANNKTFTNLERLINEHRITGIFDLESLPQEERDANRLDKVSTLCSLFVVPASQPGRIGNTNDWELYRRFLGLFDNQEMPAFTDDKAETYFGAAYSAALGSDMRTKLRFWGFTIDDQTFEQLYPTMLAKANRITSSKERTRE